MISVKEYKVLEVLNVVEAESTMNEMAYKGWRVLCVTYDNTYQCLVITFEKNV